MHRPLNGPSSGAEDHGEDRRHSSLRMLLAQPGSYPIIATAAASGAFRELPVTLSTMSETCTGVSRRWRTPTSIGSRR